MAKHHGSSCLDIEAESDLNLEKNGEEFLLAALWFPALTVLELHVEVREHVE